MVQLADDRVGAVFAALADPTRRAILARLATGEASVAELAEPFEMSQPAVSKHLKVLERAGLITRGRDAQRRPSRLEPKPLAEATEWLEHYRKVWEARYQRLDDLLDELKAGGKRRPRPRRQRRFPNGWKAADLDAKRPRSRHDSGVRCPAAAGLRCLDQARAAQTLVRWPTGLVVGGLRGRSASRRELSLPVARA